jgi:hypothetical protein
MTKCDPLRKEGFKKRKISQCVKKEK